MSLIVGYSGSRGAVIAGDMREIRFGGDDTAIAILEQDLYSGVIRDDDQLRRRAAELSVVILVRDDKEKVRERGGILTGEVTESERDQLRIRRLYLSAGHFAIADIEGSRFEIRGQGDTSTFVVLGNDMTKQIAHTAIRQNWKNGTYEDAIRVIVSAMEAAALRTASVSRCYLLFQTRQSTNLGAILAEDRLGCAGKREC